MFLRLTLACAVSLGLVLGPMQQASAQTVAEKLGGKTIKLVIPSAPGGAYGLIGLLFTQFYGRHVPGSPNIVPEYRAGAGGMVATNYLYGVAPKDGTVIGIPLAPFVLAQFTGGSSVQYDASKFVWIGQIADLNRLLAVWSTSPVKTFDELLKNDMVAGSTGRGSETFMNPAVINAVFGTRIKIVDGYKGSNDLMLALERGEINTVSGTWGNFAGNHADWIRDGKIRFLAQIGTKPLAAMPKVPMLQDLAKTDDARRLIEFMSLVTTAVGYSVLAPPGLPADLTTALRDAFSKTMADPEFLAEAKKRRIDVAPASHQEVASAVAKAVQSPKDLFERFKVAIGEK